MEFLKMKKFKRGRKPSTPRGDDKDAEQPEPTKDDSNVINGLDKSSDVHTTNVEAEAEAEDDDDDFITNEVKRRLKELRRNSFMALIPEEDSSPEDDDEEEEEEGETTSSDGRDVESVPCKFWSGLDALYDRYCEQMLFFDRLSAQQLQEVSLFVPTPSPRSQSKKLASTFRCLSLKKIKEPDDDEMEHLQQPGRDPYQDLETAYVAQLCMTWEALHCQYTQLNQIISCQPENPTSYSHTAQQFQQFQVLLQRFIENEPFEQGLRPEVFTRTRNSLPKLLQVPKIQGSDGKKTHDDDEEESEWLVLAPTLINIIESSILTFQEFLKMDKKKSGNVRKLFTNQNHGSTPLQQIQSSLEKKAMKLKEQRKKSKNWRKNNWPSVHEDVELLLSSIDVKVISRVLRMVWISKEQLFWCEEKMKKINLCNGKLQRDSSPILFPC